MTRVRLPPAYFSICTSTGKRSDNAARAAPSSLNSRTLPSAPRTSVQTPASSLTSILNCMARRALHRRRLQCCNPLLDRRMRREQRHQAFWAARDTRRLERRRQRAGLETAEPLERVDHRLRRTKQLRGSCVRAKLALAREIRDDDRREDAEHDLAYEHGDVIAGADAALAAEHRAVDDVSDDAREEDHERVDHALYQRKRHHVAVCDVRELVSEHGFDFFLVH